MPMANFEEIYAQMRDSKIGIPRADRRWRLMTYPCCFVGSEAVSWMEANLKVSREEAVRIGQRLLEAGILQHVTQSELFTDAHFFYRFQEDEDTSVLNMKRVWESGRPVRQALDVAQDLITRLACLCEENRLSILKARKLRNGTAAATGAASASAGSGDHTSAASDETVDYQSLSKSDQFRQYTFAAAELQRVDLFGLDHDERLAFFVNVYNTLCLHCHVVLGTPTNFFRRWMFFRRMSYRIAGLDFSLDDIEHGILRGNKRPPSLKFMQQLRPSDPKCQYVLKKREGRIHFVISAGTASDPPIRILDADNVEEELHFSTDEFLNHTVQINVAKRCITIPKIFSWYAEDFPSPQAELLKWIAQYLKADQQVLLLSIVGGAGAGGGGESGGGFGGEQLPTITYENFEWSAAEARFNAAVVRKKRRKLAREKKAMDQHSPFGSPAGPVNPIGVSPLLVSPGLTTVANSGLIASPALPGGAPGAAAAAVAAVATTGAAAGQGAAGVGNGNGGGGAPGWPEATTGVHAVSQRIREEQRKLQMQLQQELFQQEQQARAFLQAQQQQQQPPQQAAQQHQPHLQQNASSKRPSEREHVKQAAAVGVVAARAGGGGAPERSDSRESSSVRCAVGAAAGADQKGAGLELPVEKEVGCVAGSSNDFATTTAASATKASDIVAAATTAAAAPAAVNGNGGVASTSAARSTAKE